MGKMIDNTKKFLVILKRVYPGKTEVAEYETTDAYSAFKMAMDEIGWLDYYKNPQDYTQPAWQMPEYAMEYVKVYGVDYEDNGRIFKEFTMKVDAKYDQINSEEEKQRELEELNRLAEKYNKTVS